GGAQTVLGAATASVPYFGGNVKASLSVPSFYDNFDFESGSISNEEIAAQIKDAIAKL
ncbi:NADPH-dependent FMN reductase, partial [Vibrio cyclitrophicus]